MWLLVIDFGSTRTRVICYNTETRQRIVLEDVNGADFFASVVFADRKSGALSVHSVGDSARLTNFKLVLARSSLLQIDDTIKACTNQEGVELVLHDGRVMYKVSPPCKGHSDDEERTATDEGAPPAQDTFIDPRDALQTLMDHITRSLGSRYDAPPAHVALTFPTGTTAPIKETYKAMMLNSVKLAWHTDQVATRVHYMSEPHAAFASPDAAILRDLEAGSSICAVVDMGHSTTDVCFVYLTLVEGVVCTQVIYNSSSSTAGAAMSRVVDRTIKTCLINSLPTGNAEIKWDHIQATMEPAVVDNLKKYMLESASAERETFQLSVTTDMRPVAVAIQKVGRSMIGGRCNLPKEISVNRADFLAACDCVGVAPVLAVLGRTIDDIRTKFANTPEASLMDTASLLLVGGATKPAIVARAIGDRLGIPLNRTAIAGLRAVAEGAMELLIRIVSSETIHQQQQNLIVPMDLGLLYVREYTTETETPIEQGGSSSKTKSKSRPKSKRQRVDVAESTTHYDEMVVRIVPGNAILPILRATPTVQLFVHQPRYESGMTKMELSLLEAPPGTLPAGPTRKDQISQVQCSEYKMQAAAAGKHAEGAIFELQASMEVPGQLRLDMHMGDNASGPVLVNTDGDGLVRHGVPIEDMPLIPVQSESTSSGDFIERAIDTLQGDSSSLLDPTLPPCRC
jgi:hypothetical protein